MVEAAVLVVFGDLGRSSRLVRHAEALLRRGVDVELVGVRESPLPASVGRARVGVLPGLAWLRWRRPRILALLAAALRQCLLAALLLARLVVRLRPGVLLLVQTPPLPALPCALLAARLRGAKVVCDWHNTSAPLLALRFGGGPAARLAGSCVQRCERRLARTEILHLAVSRALATRLDNGAEVLHDLPAAAATGRRLGFALVPGLRRDAAVRERPAAPHALVAAPSSWTLDDDFDLLLAALPAADATLAAQAAGEGARLMVALTGVGERRAAVERELERLRLRAVGVVTGWVADGDYLDLLASADAGLSLHRSPSGLDLPIKLAEMAGVGTPILALDYGRVLRELIAEEATWFVDAESLAAALVRLAKEPQACPRPPRLPSWDPEWMRLLGSRLGSLGIRSAGSPA